MLKVASVVTLLQYSGSHTEEPGGPEWHMLLSMPMGRALIEFFLRLEAGSFSYI